MKLSMKAHKLDNWRAEDGVANPLPKSPVESSAPEETITLIPYAAGKTENDRVSAMQKLSRNTRGAGAIETRD